MTEKKTDALAKPRRRKPLHGIYSWVDSKRMPKGRAFAQVRAELGHLRTALIEAHGGEGIGPDAQVLVDSIVEALGVTKLAGLYIRKYGLLDQPAANQGRLEFTPLLAKHWVSYNNAVRQGLLALRELEKGKEAERGPSIGAILAEVAAAEDEAPAEGAQDPGPEADQGEEGSGTPAEGEDPS